MDSHILSIELEFQLCGECGADGKTDGGGDEFGNQKDQPGGCGERTKRKDGNRKRKAQCGQNAKTVGIHGFDIEHGMTQVERYRMVGNPAGTQVDRLGPMAVHADAQRAIGLEVEQNPLIVPVAPVENNPHPFGPRIEALGDFRQVAGEV